MNNPRLANWRMRDHMEQTQAVSAEAVLDPLVHSRPPSLRRNCSLQRPVKLAPTGRPDQPTYGIIK